MVCAKDKEANSFYKKLFEDRKVTTSETLSNPYFPFVFLFYFLLFYYFIILFFIYLFIFFYLYFLSDSPSPRSKNTTVQSFKAG